MVSASLSGCIRNSKGVIRYYVCHCRQGPASLLSPSPLPPVPLNCNLPNVRWWIAIQTTKLKCVTYIPQPPTSRYKHDANI